MTTLQLPRTDARLLTDPMPVHLDHTEVPLGRPVAAPAGESSLPATRVSIKDKIVNALLLPVEAAAFAVWSIAAIGVWGVRVLARMTFLAHPVRS